MGTTLVSVHQGKCRDDLHFDSTTSSCVDAANLATPCTGPCSLNEASTTTRVTIIKFQTDAFLKAT